MTKCTGLEDLLVDPAMFAADCQKAFACSATADELPGKGQGWEVVVQGTIVDKVAAHLTAAYHVPRAYITTKGGK